MKKLFCVLVLAGAVALQSVAFAGAVSTFSVYVAPGQAAYGALKTARNSANTTEWIGCSAFGATGGTATYVSCSAVDAAGNYFYCSTYNAAPQMVQAALAVTATSYLLINADANYNCSYILVGNYSQYS